MQPLTISDWQSAYRSGQTTPQLAIGELLAALDPLDPAWILKLDAAGLALQIEKLDRRVAALGGDTSRLPLYGVPFAVKDNIDIEGLPTTAACPAYAYVAKLSAPAVQRLLDAGAILIGKTNLDQFATGLVGTRSPYGIVPNTFDARYIGGGSSSGSASAVARGLVPFALGTDTAGSGRVPAGCNNLVGLKPTRGWISSGGLVPACRSLDCVSVFALTMEDAECVTALVAGYDEADPYARAAPPTAPAARLPARPRFGIPATPQWFGDHQAATAFAQACARMQELGASLVPLDFTPLHQIATLLYEGAWIAERYASLADFIEREPAAIHPLVHDIIGAARGMSAVDAFKSEYRRVALARPAQKLMGSVDALLVPTAPMLPTLADVAAEPLAINAQLGTYTNFVNLLDWCALAMPAGFRGDGLPFGITLIAPAWQDAALSAFGRLWQAHAPWPLGATGRSSRPAAITVNSVTPPGDDVIRLAVVGAHLSGMPLNNQLTERGARLVETTTTSDSYRLLALPGTSPPKPGLIKAGNGACIEVELWDLPRIAFGSFIALVGPPLCIGTLDLVDGRKIKGFLCESWALAGARDITACGGWRNYMASTVEV